MEFNLENAIPTPHGYENGKTTEMPRFVSKYSGYALSFYSYENLISISFLFIMSKNIFFSKLATHFDRNFFKDFLTKIVLFSCHSSTKLNLSLIVPVFYCCRTGHS